MRASRKLNRRSFVASVVGGVALVGGAAGAQNTQRGRLHDCDSGAAADIPGGGGPKPGSDRDTGPSADPPCNGRPRIRAQSSASGCSDTDSGRNADPARRGRRC